MRGKDKYTRVAIEDSDNIQTLPCKVQTGFAHLDIRGVSWLVIVIEYPEIKSFWTQFEDVYRSGSIGNAVQNLFSTLDVRHCFQRELGDTVDSRSNHD